MIQVSIYLKNGKISAFGCKGHSGYAEHGRDIVCAAVSALTINTVNAIETFTKDRFQCSENDGELHFAIVDKAGPETELLLKSLQLGLQNIEKEYSSRYIKVTIVNC